MDNHFEQTAGVAETERQLLAATIVPAGNVLTRVVPPSVHGIYAWWMEPGSVPGLTGMRHPVDTPLELLYVGIAGGPRSNLHARLSTHLTKTSRRSTLRLSLASLLAPSMGWTASIESGRPVLDPTFERYLSSSMKACLSVSWIRHGRPKQVETEIITRLRPPLNLEGNTTHLLYPYVKAARATFRSSLS